MKRIIAITLTLLMVFSLFACGKGGTDPTNENNNSSESSSAEADSTEADASTQAADPSKLETGSEGTGPAELKTELFSVKTPEGLDYEVYNYYVSKDDPLQGSINIFFNEGYTTPIKLNATTQNMVKSQEEAVEKTIKLRNLDTYKNETSVKEGEDVKFGNYTYSTLNIKTEYGENNYYILYVNRGANDKEGIYITVDVDSKFMKADDARVAEILSSLSVVMEK